MDLLQQSEQGVKVPLSNYRESNKLKNGFDGNGYVFAFHGVDVRIMYGKDNGRWAYLHRAVDKRGITLDFVNLRFIFMATIVLPSSEKDTKGRMDDNYMILQILDNKQFLHLVEQNRPMTIDFQLPVSYFLTEKRRMLFANVNRTLSLVPVFNLSSLPSRREKYFSSDQNTFFALSGRVGN